MSTPPPKKVKLYSGMRKTARATASITPGSGRVRVNGFLVDAIPNELQREVISAPLRIASEAASKVDIDVSVKGGGYMGQANACAIAITKALVGSVKGSELKKRLMEYDRHLLAGDPRQTEPKKFGGPGARRRKQKSYR